MYNNIMGFKNNIRIYVWVEFLIWVVILVLCILGFRFYCYEKSRELPSYQIFMPDVDGMIIGSPVKYMGVQVGYIQSMKILTNNVYVKFVITDKELKLPKGAIVTVEFNGLGGSKSLEIYPPDKTTQNDKFIVIKSPKRLHDSMGLLNDMFDKLGAINGKISHFAKEAGLVDKKIEHLKINPQNIEKNIRQTDDFVDNMIESRNNFQNKVKEWKHEQR